MKISRLSLLLLVLACVGGVWLYLLALERSYQEEEYTLIGEGLYMGRAVASPPPGTEAVVNLCDGKDQYTCDANLWEPIRDAAPAPDLDWLKKVVDFIDTQRRAGKTIYVHCAAGVSRSGMVVTAYFMYKNHWTRDQALAFVRSKRPLTRPNPAFMDLLLEWEQRLKESSV